MPRSRIRFVGALCLGLLPLGVLANEDCYWLTDGGAKMVAIEGWDFTTESAKPGLVTLPEAPETAQAILCERDDPVPQPHDFEALIQGKPLFVRAGVGRAAVVTALGSEDGAFKLSVQQGSVTDAQRALITERLEGFYAAYDALRADE